MNKKYILAGISCGFIIISGICYSCTYQEKKDAVLISALQEEGQGSEEPGPQNRDLTNTAVENISIEDNPAFETEQELQEKHIYVHICGAVTNPGVYEVGSNARLVDLIELSGGFLEDAAADYINQAQQVSDGQRVYIPNKDEVKELSVNEIVAGNQEESSSKADAPTLININTASAEELMSLPGIGQAKASSIIEYRKVNGNFSNTEDLMMIPGIKEGLFNQISSYITVK